MNKVLIITYYWPPSGGAGVQRWLKFSKYLPQLGWEPVILTVDPEYAVYPALDPSLEKDIPEGIRIYRTKATNWFRIYSNDKSRVPSSGFAKNFDDSLKGKISRFIRGNFFIPDPRRGWNRYAIRKVCEIIKKEKIKHIITTSPPHSTQLIGLKLKKKYPDIKWIADLRDPWIDIYYYRMFYPTPLSKSIDNKYESKVLRNADLIITVGNSLAAEFADKADGLSNKIHVISNGFDEEDFEGVERKNPGIFTITYVGTLSDVYPIDSFLTAMFKAGKAGKDFLVRFVGSVAADAKIKIERNLSKGRTEFLPYLSHSEVIQLMVASSMLLLVIPAHVFNKVIITGKLFEYIASGQPILCLGPVDGDAAEIIARSGSGTSFAYDDVEGIENYILSTLATSTKKGKSIPLEFSLEFLAKQLASLL